MKILIIEDDNFFQKFYSTKLAESGYEVAIAVNGKDGLDQVKKIKPDLILLDIIMPEKDGFEVLSTLAHDSTLKKIPVIVFSTLGQVQDIEKAKKLGARDYIDKSYFDLSQLKAKISLYIK